MYLLDTNILTAYFYGDAAITEAMGRHRGQGIFTSSVNIWEVINGCNQKILQTKTDYHKTINTKKHQPGDLPRQFDTLYKAMSQLQVVPFKRYDLEAERLFQTLPKKYHTSEKLADGMIASVALVNGLILVTRNERDFKEIVDLEIVVW